MNLYQEFKKYYSPSDIIPVLKLFGNDNDKVRYAIAVNIARDKKESLYNTALRVKEEKGLDEYSKLIKKLIKEEPEEIYKLNEMTTGAVSEDGFKFMKYFFREQREWEKFVNKEKGMNLEKALRHAGMHIIH